jgi:hypothetical protein
MKTVLKDIGWEGTDWNDVVQQRVQCQALMNMEIKCNTLLD